MQGAIDSPEEAARSQQSPCVLTQAPDVPLPSFSHYSSLVLEGRHLP